MVLRDLEPRVNVLARAWSNLPDQSTKAGRSSHKLLYNDNDDMGGKKGKENMGLHRPLDHLISLYFVATDSLKLLDQLRKCDLLKRQHSI
jgi:hypothetical protein